MVLQIRDAKLTDKAPKLVLDKKNELILAGHSSNVQRGVVVNKLLNEYAELLEKLKAK